MRSSQRGKVQRGGHLGRDRISNTRAGKPVWGEPHQLVHAVRFGGCKSPGDAPADRVTKHMGFLDATRVQQGADEGDAARIAVVLPAVWRTHSVARQAYSQHAQPG